MVSLIATAAAHGHVAVPPHHAFVTDDVVRMAHDEGMAVNTWTCDDPDRIREPAALGVGAVVTNAPDVALAVLSRCGPAGGPDIRVRFRDESVPPHAHSRRGGTTVTGSAW